MSMGDPFSQADSRVIDRPSGNNGIVELGRRMDLLNRQLDMYVSQRAMPGGIHEQWVRTAVAAGIAGSSDSTLLYEHDLGFPAHSIAIDNLTSQWLWVEPANRAVPPYTIGWVIPCVSAGGQNARVSIKTPPGTIGFNPVTGESAYIVWHEAFLPPMAGVPIPSQAITNGAAGQPQLPPGATQLTGQGGPSANTAITGTLAGVAGKFTWLTGFTVSGDGSTAGATIVVTVTGLVGGTLSFVVAVPASVAGSVFVPVTFATPLQSSVAGGNIVVSVPAFGAGNVNAAVTVTGFAL